MFEVFPRLPFGQDPIFERVSVLLVDVARPFLLVVASEEAGLGSEEKDVQLFVLASVSVSEKTRIVLDGSEDCVMPGPGQRCNMARGAMKTHTFLPSRLLFVGGEGCLHFPDMVAFE